jgi:predicted PhzF superfamily epimerase YddE/YHI9
MSEGSCFFPAKSRWSSGKILITGSAHCCLGPYWGEKLNKSELNGFQCSARGGTVRVTLHNDRVILGGHAVHISSGQLLA